MNSCGTFIHRGDPEVLIGHDTDRADKYWQDTLYKDKHLDTKLGPGIMRSYHQYDTIPCGWKNDFVTAICLACARKEGYIW